MKIITKKVDYNKPYKESIWSLEKTPLSLRHAKFSLSQVKKIEVRYKENFLLRIKEGNKKKHLLFYKYKGENHLTNLFPRISLNKRRGSLQIDFFHENLTQKDNERQRQIEFEKEFRKDTWDF